MTDDDTILYVAEYGDYLVKIADEHGTTWQAIWNHPRNAEHRLKRGSPDILGVGDVLHIPTPQSPDVPPVPPAPPAPPAEPPPGGTKPDVPPWPYPEPPSQEKPRSVPTWDCPGGTCVCHPNDEEEPTAFAVLLCDRDGTRMKHARCRVKHNGKLLFDDVANEHGWVSVGVARMPNVVRVEWAPQHTPIAPPYPHRTWCELARQGERDDDATLRRLANVGFSRGPDPETRVRGFQEHYEYTRITGSVADIRETALSYHDDHTLPIVPGVDSPADDAVRAADGPDDEDDDGPVEPGVPKEPPPPPPPKAGNGATPQQTVTAAPLKFTHITIKFRSRYAFDPPSANASIDQFKSSEIRWSDTTHFKHYRKAATSMSIVGAVQNLSGTGNTEGADGIIRTFSLSSLKSLTGVFAGTITLVPDVDNRLRPGTGVDTQPVVPSDKNSTLTLLHVLHRPVEIDFTINDAGEFLTVGATKMVRTIRNGRQVTNCRVQLVASQNTILVDWRADFVQGFGVAAKTKVTDSSGTEVAPDALVVIHQTSTPLRAGSTRPQIGSTLNFFTNKANKPTGAHYVVDLDGFVVKMANEDLFVKHAGGPAGAAWAGQVGGINDTSVGIEHVHAATIVGHPATSFTTDQLSASQELIADLVPFFHTAGTPDTVVTHNQVSLIDPNNQGAHVGHKPSCIGTGYDWEALETMLRARASRFAYTFKTTGQEQQLELYLANFDFLDSNANGLGHFAYLRKALAGMGYQIPDIKNDDDGDDIRGAAQAFMIRHFGGPTRAKKLAKVHDGTDDMLPVLNEDLCKAILATQ